MRQWQSREDLCQEGTGYHLDKIKDLQDLVDYLNTKIERLENLLIENATW